VHKRLQFWLMQELGGREPKLFVDEDNIETGDRWPDSLRDALKASRCMVCVWSPSYFQSSWCVSEWRRFLARERRLNLHSHGLIAPLRFHDGEHFPEEAGPSNGPTSRHSRRRCPPSGPATEPSNSRTG
jgi:hypothetical protein